MGNLVRREAGEKPLKKLEKKPKKRGLILWFDFDLVIFMLKTLSPWIYFRV